MSARPPLSHEVAELLEREREIPPLPAAQRARALARARAALDAGPANAPAPMAVRAARPFRWAVAVALLLFAGAAAAAAAYQIHLRRMATSRPSAPVRARVAEPPPPVPEAPLEAPPPLAAVPGPSAVVPGPAAAPSGPSAAEVARAELRLLGQARAAVARGDYAAALPPLAEHARRFKNGRLVEEREALRVKALAGLGRIGEARRAAVAFRARFPRSVLLPAVTRMPAAATP